MTKRPEIVLLVLLLLVAAFPSFAQNSTADAIVSGVLTDPSGGALSGVKVTAEATSPAGLVYSARSDGEGKYKLTLPPGHYQITITREPFTTRTETMELQSAEARTLNLRLELEPLSSKVLVTAQSEPVLQELSTVPVSIVSSVEIQQRQAVVIADMLYTQAGVNIARTGAVGGLTTAFIDGGNSNYTKVILDGTPVNEPGGNYNLSNLTLDNVEKFEVVHGSQSAVYGSDAMTGVIQLFSHRGTTRIPSVQLFAEGGSFSSARGGGQISGLLDKFDYSVAGSYTQTDGQGPNDSFLNRSLSGNFGYGFSDTNQLRLTLRSNNSWAGIPGPTLFYPASLTQYDALNNLSANLTWTFATGPRWQHRLSGIEARTLDTNADPAIYTAVDQYNRAGFYEQSTYGFTKGILALGYQVEVENGYPSLITGTHAQRIDNAGFVDVRWTPISRLSVNAGARIDSNPSFGTKFIPRIGAVGALRYGHGFWGDTRAHISYGQGVKEPGLDQVFGTDPCYPGNPDLKAEQSRTFSTGVDQYLASDRLRVRASYFYNRFQDVISYALNPGNNPYGCGTYFNTNLARAQGLNLVSELRLRKWLAVDGNYTYDATRVIKSENPFADPALIPGNRLLRRPANSGSLAMNIYYARFNWNLLGYFSGVRTDSNFVNPTQTNNAGYARFDSALSYDVARGFFLTARVTNLFNKQYQDALGYPALGRDYRFGIRYNFPGHN